MNRGRVLIAALISLGAVALVGGCSDTHYVSTRLDKVSKHLEEYGTVTLSYPIVSTPDERYSIFNMSVDTKDYFTGALTQVQGAAAAYDQVRQTFAASASAQYDPAALGAFRSALDQFRAYRTQLSDFQLEHRQAAQTDFSSKVAAANKIEDEPMRLAAVAKAEKEYADAIAPDGNAHVPWWTDEDPGPPR